MKNEITIKLKGNGETISECAQKVERYCDKMSAYRYYDLVVTPQDEADEITISDICVANKIGARMSDSDVERFWQYVSQNRTEIKERLVRIPTSMELYEVDEATFFDDLRELFSLFFDKKKPRVKRISHARVTKTLHRKRPGVIPIIDSRTVIRNYTGTWGWLDMPTYADYLVEVTRYIRQDIAINLDQLKEIRRKVPKSSGLTILRIFDILLYQHYFKRPF